MEKKYIVKFILIAIVVATIIYFLNNQTSTITNFEECIEAGNPTMGSYPRQCRDPFSKKTFVEDVDAWRLDSIGLMQHETEGYFGCFGCNTAADGPAWCVDPSFEMKPVEETPKRYCNSDFEVVERGEVTSVVF